MKIDVYTSTGAKSGSAELPAALFEAPINKGLMHLALLRQQSNRRHPIAHVKHRGEVVGTTKKAYQQKGTGNARRGALRSPLLRGGGKSFGPRNDANFTKDMPKKMRRAALFSCLSFTAKEGRIIGLESYPDAVKTKDLHKALMAMKLELGRKIVIVLPGRHKGLELSARNIENVRTIHAPYLNPEDVLGARHLIFMVDAIKTAEDTFTKESTKLKVKEETPIQPKAVKAPKKAKETKTPAAKKKAPKASDSSSR